MSEIQRYRIGRVMTGVAGQTAVALLPDINGEAVYYTDHAASLRERDERIAELEAQLAALQWTEITPENLPKVGDEVKRPDGCKAVVKHNNPQILAVTESMVHLFSDMGGLEMWNEQSWTHFRPINPPTGARA